MEFNLKKGVQVINFFARHEQEVTGVAIDKLKILKLVWIADRLHLRKYGKPIVGDTYFAMKFGPVASSIKHICEINDKYIPEKAKEYIKEFIQKLSYKIRSKKEVDVSLFSDSNLEILEMVWERFGNHGSFKLVDFTHEYPEWTKFKEKLESGQIIQAEMDYIDFFENTPVQNEVFNIDEEMLELSKDIFKENYNFSKLFA